jgi:hypothetical protein
MKSSFLNSTIILSVFFIFIIFFVSIFIPILTQTDIPIVLNDEVIEFDYTVFNISGSSFLWPVPGYTTITSKFGYRVAPTARCFYISFWN